LVVRARTVMGVYTPGHSDSPSAAPATRTLLIFFAEKQLNNISAITDSYAPSVASIHATSHD
jgi:hypothetical protein